MLSAPTGSAELWARLSCSPEGFVLAAGRCASTISSRVLASDLRDGRVLNRGDDVLLAKAARGKGYSAGFWQQCPTVPGHHGIAPLEPLTSTRACRRRCVRGPKGHPSSGCSCWASDFFRRASTSGKKQERGKSNPKGADMSSGAGLPQPFLGLAPLGTSPPSPSGQRQGWDWGTFSVQLSQWPQDTFLLVSSSCCPGSIFLLLQQVLLCPTLGVMLPQRWNLQEQGSAQFLEPLPCLPPHQCHGSIPGTKSHCEVPERMGREGRGRGLGAFHLVVLSLILWRLEQLLQDSDLLVGEIGTVRLHRCPEPARTDEL